MKTIEISKANASLASYVREARARALIVTRRGKPIAAVVSLENADAESISLSTNAEFLALIEQSRARQRAKGGVPAAEVRRRFGVKRRAKRSPTSR